MTLGPPAKPFCVPYLERRQDIEQVAGVCLWVAYLGVDPGEAHVLLVADLDTGGPGWQAACLGRPFPDILQRIGLRLPERLRQDPAVWRPAVSRLLHGEA